MAHKAYEIEEILKITAFYSMFECVRPGDYSFKGETHDFWECVYVMDGKVCLAADDRVYHMKTGDFIFHKPLELHKYHVDKNDFAKLFIFSFSLSGDLASFFENKVLTLSQMQRDIIFSLIDFFRSKTNSSSDSPPKDHLLPVLAESKSNMFIAVNYVYRLFLSISESFNESAETDNEKTKIFKTAVNYMSDNIHLMLTIDDIAEKCCVSSSGLKKIFMLYTGLGVHKYFLRLKLNRATALLAGGKSINAISEALGFSSQAYFSAAFKREFGYSPSKYTSINT